MQKLVSICTPCYNHEKYLDDYFQSIIAQTYQDIELILIDDCSTDNSVKIINEWLNRLEARFSKVVFLKNEKNLGVTKTCNKLIFEASGDYIKLLASDDMLHPDFIKVNQQFMEENEKALVCSGNYYFADNDSHYSTILAGIGKELEPAIAVEKEEVFGLNEFLSGKRLVCTPTVVFRKKCFEIYGMFDESIAIEDFEYWIRIFKNNEKMHYMNKALTFYRKSDTSMSNIAKNSKQKFSKLEFIFRNAEKSMQKHITPGNCDEQDYLQKFYTDYFLNSCVIGHKKLKNEIKNIIKTTKWSDSDTSQKLKTLYKKFAVLDSVKLLNIALAVKKKLNERRDKKANSEIK